MIFARREAESLRLAGIRVQNFYLASRTSLSVLLREWRRFRREQAEFRPHLVHGHFGTMTGLFCVLASRIPVVLTFRGTDLNPDPTLPGWRTILGRFFSRISAIRASRIICVTAQLRDRLWWGRKKVSVMPGSVNLELFRPIEREEACRRMGWNVESRKVLFNAGHFPKIKRPDLAAKAVRIAQEIVGNVELIELKGDTPPEMIPTVLSAADCVLVTSDWEGSPTIVREAMACNLPVVSVNVGDVPEMIRESAPGAIVDRDPAKLGEAVAEVLKFPMRSNGRERIAHLGEERVAFQIRQIYESALGWNEKREHGELPSRSVERLVP